ncbi:lipase family protein [Nocardia sp. CDC153]|uniref:lipase family protein n=1 Tax=Nocardia sp. CDC153 TaxID=3112167 RepID=UPI002DBD0ADC|nr:lipase family protein [Nocardia sp. CDC153]MEC3956361.1 lipase family protein [Nocardia sp. CDC153]
MRRFIALGALPVLLVLAAAPVGASPLYPTPDPDPFYAAPPDIGAAAPGEVLAVRAMPPLPLFPGVSVSLVKFRSTNSAGDPIAATTTVLRPANAIPGAPLLSYQHIINGLGTQCAVSHVLYTQDPNLAVREAPVLNGLLLRGWSIALPDHLGPTIAYGAARLGGLITLDGIRAVQRVREFGLQTSPVALLGYSGGGMATSWAAALQPQYAPELHLVGAAEGGVPMNLVKMIEGLGYQHHPVFGLALAAAIGLEREYPDQLPVSDNMNAAGIAARNAIANGCTNDILVAGAGHSVLDFAASTSLVSDPRARRVVEDNSIELFDGVPGIPIFEWHAPQDALIPVDAIDNTMRHYCAAGLPVESELFPSPDHLTTAVLGAPTAINWIDARFRGEPAPSNC